jgi:hypothetical protein
MSLKNFHMPTRISPAAKAVIALSMLVFLGACASKGPPPTAELSMARAAITQAEASGAGQASPVELLAARDKLARAEAALRSEQYDSARRLAQQSAADAELAETTARADRARRAVTELEQGNAALKRETEKKR